MQITARWDSSLLSSLFGPALVFLISSPLLCAQTSPANPAPENTPAAPAVVDRTVMAPLPHFPLNRLPDTVGKATPIPVTNGSFENGLEGWTVLSGNPAVFTVEESAVAMGAKGLSIKGDSSGEAKLIGEPIPVTAGHIYGAQIWGRNRVGNGIGASMNFYGADGTILAPIRIKGTGAGAGFAVKGHFEAGDMRAIAPEGATTVRFIIGGGKNTAGDIDDLHFWELTEPGTPLFVDVEAVKAEIAANPTRGLPLPKIVIKLDDMTKKNAAWDKVFNYMKEKGGLKVNFGIICNSLEAGTPEYFQWIKDMNASGNVEFWNHGYDHGVTKVNDVDVQEFKQPYEYQKKHMDDAQRLAVEKLGFPLVTFGAPFNAVNADTVKIMSETPEMKVWMYGDPRNTGGKVVLDRLGCVNLENPTFLPDFQKFINGYAHNRGFPYYCMQGHPQQWDEARLANFKEIVDFLAEQKTPFVKASELTEKDILIPGFETLFTEPVAKPPATP